MSGHQHHIRSAVLGADWLSMLLGSEWQISGTALNAIPARSPPTRVRACGNTRPPAIQGPFSPGADSSRCSGTGPQPARILSEKQAVVCRREAARRQGGGA
jgi:hypothetical protein